MSAISTELVAEQQVGRGDRIRTCDPLRPRQVRYQAALRPDSEDPRFYSGFSLIALSRASLFRRKLSQNCPRTPTDCPRIPPIHHPACPKTPADSLAARLSFCSASRFICNFICEYFLNTFASPWRRSCVTHSSATPPALKRVA